MKDRQILFLIYFLFFVILCGFAQTRTIQLGGKNGWSEFSVMNGVTKGEGRFGYESIQLATDSKKITKNTDMLVNFEGNTIKDETGNYTVVSNNLFTAEKAIMGKKSGVSRGLGTGIRLKGKTGTLFGTSGFTGPFVISFWLYPAVAASGEQILSWRSSRNLQGYSMYQLITATVFNSRMEWKFTNIFNSNQKDGTDFTLTGRTVLVPETWSHHTLSYNDVDGLLEYRINGKLEAVLYVTSNQSEYGTIYPAELGVPAEIDICPKYLGLIDDFYISRTAYTEYDNEVYAQAGGRFETQPLKTAGYGSQLTLLDAIGLNPAQTDVVYYVRAGNNFYEWNHTSPEWIRVLSGKPITGITGEYFQVAAELYPDGKGTVTPSISEITLTYTVLEPPPPPVTLKVTAGDGFIDVEWRASADVNVEGYLLYYGEKPGEYLGRSANEGISPLSTGKHVSLRLTGLKNGTLYYFAVAAITANGKIIGPLSKEAYARPLRTPQ